MNIRNSVVHADIIHLYLQVVWRLVERKTGSPRGAAEEEYKVQCLQSKQLHNKIMKGMVVPLVSGHIITIVTTVSTLSTPGRVRKSRTTCLFPVLAVTTGPFYLQ